MGDGGSHYRGGNKDGGSTSNGQDPILNISTGGSKVGMRGQEKP